MPAMLRPASLTTIDAFAGKELRRFMLRMRPCRLKTDGMPRRYPLVNAVLLTGALGVLASNVSIRRGARSRFANCAVQVLLDPQKLFNIDQGASINHNVALHSRTV